MAKPICVYSLDRIKWNCIRKDDAFLPKQQHLIILCAKNHTAGCDVGIQWSDWPGQKHPWDDCTISSCPGPASSWCRHGNSVGKSRVWHACQSYRSDVINIALSAFHSHRSTTGSIIALQDTLFENMKHIYELIGLHSDCWMGVPIPGWIFYSLRLLIFLPHAAVEPVFSTATRVPGFRLSLDERDDITGLPNQ